MSDSLQRTPLYDLHLQLGGKIVPFAGWELPVKYSGLIEEHNAVRSAVGLFDVSHMGEILVEGPEAEAALNYLTCNAVHKLTDGKAQYSAIINENGGVVDDIIIYRYSPTRYLLCVNAANVEKDFAWLSSKNSFEANFTNCSAEYAQIAIQGPQAQNLLAELLSPELAATPYFSFCEARAFSSQLIIARTGYTGEDGFEIFIPNDAATDVAQACLEIGQKFGLLPCGLGARDTLRLEACYPLHGHELGDDISAIESGIGWIVKLNKGDFIGRPVLEKHKTEGAPRTLVGFYVLERGIVREECELFDEMGKSIGRSTSGTRTPTIDKALGLALVARTHADVGSTFFADVRGRKLECQIVETPFYKR